MGLEIIPVCFEDAVGPGTDLASLILSRAAVRDGDIVVVSQKAVSKREGRTVRLDSVAPSLLARGIASQYGKDARVVELVLSESRRIVRMARGVIITETRHGFVCANAGVDESNVEPGHATLLPADSDVSARDLRDAILEQSGRRVAVLVSDTFGRPFRAGQTDCAIGSCGMDTVRDYRGTRDSAGRRLRVSEIAIADEICAAAELVKAKSANCPAAIVRNFGSDPRDVVIGALLRREDEDLFR